MFLFKIFFYRGLSNCFLFLFLCLLSSVFSVVAFLFYTIFHNCTQFSRVGFSDIHNLFALLCHLTEYFGSRRSHTLDFLCGIRKRALALYIFPEIPLWHPHSRSICSECKGRERVALLRLAHISSHFHDNNKHFHSVFFFSSSTLLPRIL